MKTALVLGTFDGLHEGHRAVLKKAEGFYTVAVTFDVPPKAFFTLKPELLMCSEDKNDGLLSLGVSEVFSLKFTDVCSMSAEEFFLFLKEKFSPKLIVCGFNYAFGAGAKGDTALLKDLCEQNSIDFCAVEAVGEGVPISSSYLRKLAVSGDIEEVNRHIYSGFGFKSEVLHGDSRGSLLGFPTINQAYPENLVRIRFGVYKSRVIVDGKEYDSITNIGVRPTYKTDFIGCETYIKDFSADIYGKTVTLKFLKFIRDEEKFSDVKALERAVKDDIKSVLGIDINN